MDNSDFLQIIKNAFITCLQTSERSTAKLKILHGAIAEDLDKKLNNIIIDKFAIVSKGFGIDKEYKILGRYIDKAVDITIINKENNKIIAGIAVKFVMSNYSQNSNNYFENMLGETANIRSAQIPYFQIFIIPDVLPYYERSGNLSHWEEITKNNLCKYIKLSEDNVDSFLHTPNKTLVFIINISNNKFEKITTKEKFINYYLNNDFSVKLSNLEFKFGENIIYNDYVTFISKIVYYILSL